MFSPYKTIFIVLAFLILYGCAELTKHAETIRPTAHVTAVRLANINFDQADIIFDIAVDNKNPITIDLAGLDYDFKVEGQSLISGNNTRPSSLQLMLPVQCNCP